MTRKDYVAIAAVLRTADKDTTSLVEGVVVDEIRHDLADYFKATNPAFDSKKFFNAATAVQE